MIVVDTNVIVYFVVRGPLSAAAEALHDHDPHWIAPRLWRSEMRNVLLGHVRRGQLSFDQAAACQTQGELLMAGSDYDVASHAVLSMARDSGCSAYDCEFVALSIKMGVPLHTADRKLQRAFPDTTSLLTA